jgi:hypothetical protein
LAAAASAVGTFGPRHCASVSRTPAGTCQFETRCRSSAELKSVEFSFICVDKEGQKTKHDFGVGGFDARDKFDTSVSCAQCLSAEEPASAEPLPPASSPAVAPTTAEPTKKEDKKAEETAEKAAEKADEKAEAEAVKFGPHDCVKTYRNKAGTCVVETNCSADDIEHYEFGFLCKEKGGDSTRHLFGRNSFDPKETFDTLISCEECLGLEDVEETAASNAKIGRLEEDVKGIEDSLKKIGSRVEQLEHKVFTTAAATEAATKAATEAPKEAATDAPAEAPANLVAVDDGDDCTEGEEDCD